MYCYCYKELCKHSKLEEIPGLITFCTSLMPVASQQNYAYTWPTGLLPWHQVLWVSFWEKQTRTQTDEYESNYMLFIISGSSLPWVFNLKHTCLLKRVLHRDLNKKNSVFLTFLKNNELNWFMNPSFHLTWHTKFVFFKTLASEICTKNLIVHLKTPTHTRIPQFLCITAPGKKKTQTNNTLEIWILKV